jgi:hypothetical protein
LLNDACQTGVDDRRRPAGLRDQKISDQFFHK